MSSDDHARQRAEHAILVDRMPELERHIDDPAAMRAWIATLPEAEQTVVMAWLEKSSGRVGEVFKQLNQASE